MSEVLGIQRISSGVAGLDVILRGGFPRGGIHIIQGEPGTGKTILGNQICYYHARQGGRALYVTLLAESHARMLLHLSTLRFFETSLLPDAVSYISGLHAMETEGLPALISLLRREAASRKAGIMVMDGLVSAADHAESDSEFKKFIKELQIQASLQDCTVFLLATSNSRRARPEHTMVDSIVELTDVRYGSRTERGLFVNKLRGSDYLPGRHPFHITQDGLIVYPRIEALYQQCSQPDQIWKTRISTGIPGLDGLIGGGLPEASVTGVVGPSGIGKTTLGMHFLNASTRNEPGLLFGFYETPARLRHQARTLGLDLDGAVRRGDLEIIWQALGEDSQDALAHRLLEAVGRRQVRRLFFDGIGGFLHASFEPDRIARFFSALSNELRCRGVTAMYTFETRDLLGPGVEVPVSGISSMVEGLIALRFVEHQSRSRRLLSVMKVRASHFDPALREFFITDGKGISVGDSFQGTEHLLSGFARDRPGATSREAR